MVISLSGGGESVEKENVIVHSFLDIEAARQHVEVNVPIQLHNFKWISVHDVVCYVRLLCHIKERNIVGSSIFTEPYSNETLKIIDMGWFGFTTVDVYNNTPSRIMHVCQKLLVSKISNFNILFRRMWLGFTLSWDWLNMIYSTPSLSDYQFLIIRLIVTYCYVSCNYSSLESHLSNVLFCCRHNK